MRDRENGEVTYGRRPVLELLRARRRRVFSLFIRSSTRESEELEAIRRLAQEEGVTIRPADEAMLVKMTGDVNHQGVAARVSEYSYTALEDMWAHIEKSGEPAFVLMLDHLQDPQNVGSILRTADAAGCHGVVIPKDRAASITPAVVRASAGASEHIRVAQVTNLVQTMRSWKEKGVWFVGLDMAPEAKAYTELDMRGATGLVVGHEGHGLGRLVRETCDHLVRLPLRGAVESLNAGVAAGVALYEVRRQRDVSA